MPRVLTGAHGGVPEWPIGTALKAVVGRPTAGSNPAPSATSLRHDAPVTSRTRSLLVLGDLAVQLSLVLVGLLLLLSQDDAGIIRLMRLWSLIATLYVLGAIVLLAVAVRRPASAPAGASEHSRASRLVSTTAMFMSSVVGLGSALTLLLEREDPEWGEGYQVIGVWAMLAAWALFHWGFARIYAARYRLDAERPLRFPGGQEPRLADFVYFAFTNATSFATPDVTVLTTRMRWTVLWHTTLGFFFNALIVVLAVNTIIG